MPGTKHYYFQDSIGQGNWFSYGTTLQDVRYAVEGYAAFDGELGPDSVLPDEVIFHYPKCYGGDVWEGYGIFNYKRSLAARGVKTTSIIEGLCASIATLTAMGSDTVLMAEAAFWMVHKPMVDAGPDANADEHQQAIVVLTKIQDQLAGRYVARSGGKLDLATAHSLINQTSWLTADECLAYGFITGKLEDAPLEAPVGAEKVLNYLPKSALKSVAMPALTTAEKTGLFGEFKNWLAKEFGLSPKSEGEGTPPPATNAVTSADVDGGDPMYFDGTDLAQGTAVYSDEAMTTAYADGDYTLADGRAATVAAGVISSLTDAESEDSATNAADEALVAENTAVKAENALLKRKLDAATNKLAKVVPGSTGSPTPPGSAPVNVRRPAAVAPKNEGASPLKIRRH